MLNVRFDYGFIGRLFGVPRKFLSQVGAFCASFASGHQIIDVRTPAFPDPEKNPVTVGIDEEELKKFIKEQSIVPDNFDFSQMFQTSAGATGSYTKITLTPLKIDASTQKLAWDTANAVSFEVLNSHIITP